MRSTRNRNKIRSLKSSLQHLTDAELVALRKASADRETRKAVKSILLKRHMPSVPFQYFDLNRRPERGAPECTWQEWRTAIRDYRQTDEYRETEAAVNAARDRVDAMLGETRETPQTGVEIGC